ncbi:MAG TPA: hypothetical protein VK832_14000, partial [Burkholderiaceae bacterium]|nr:hypothetical protein [Burkholderiaceae bacterium]
ELNRDITPEITALKKSPDVADVASYQLLPASASQHPVLMLLCLSESACTHMANKQKKEGSTNIAIGKGRLMLLIAPDSVDDTQLKKIKTSMSRFTPG